MEEAAACLSKKQFVIKIVQIDSEQEQKNDSKYIKEIKV